MSKHTNKKQGFRKSTNKFKDPADTASERYNKASRSLKTSRSPADESAKRFNLRELEGKRKLTSKEGADNIQETPESDSRRGTKGVTGKNKVKVSVSGTKLLPQNIKRRNAYGPMLLEVDEARIEGREVLAEQYDPSMDEVFLELGSSLGEIATSLSDGFQASSDLLILAVESSAIVSSLRDSRVIELLAFGEARSLTVAGFKDTFHLENERTEELVESLLTVISIVTEPLGS